MNSNNDLMDKNYVAQQPTPFIAFMNAKKIEYNNTHSDAFNTVHVTNWANEYVSDLQSQLTALQKEHERVLGLISHIVNNSSWIRLAGKTYMQIEVENNADLSCKAMRRFAIESLRAKKSL